MNVSRLLLLGVCGGVLLPMPDAAFGAALIWDYNDSDASVVVTARMEEDNTPICNNTETDGASPMAVNSWYSATVLCESADGEADGDAELYTGNMDGSFQLSAMVRTSAGLPFVGGSTAEVDLSCAFEVTGAIPLTVAFHFAASGSQGGCTGRVTLRGPSGVLDQFEQYTLSWVEYDEEVTLSASVVEGETYYLEIHADLDAWDNNFNSMGFDNFVIAGPTPAETATWGAVKDAFR